MPGNVTEVLVLAGLRDLDGERRGVSRMQGLRHLARARVLRRGLHRGRAELEGVEAEALVRHLEGVGADLRFVLLESWNLSSLGFPATTVMTVVLASRRLRSRGIVDEASAPAASTPAPNARTTARSALRRTRSSPSGHWDGQRTTDIPLKRNVRGVCHCASDTTRRRAIAPHQPENLAGDLHTPCAEQRFLDERRYQRSRCTTLASGRRSGAAIGESGRSRG